MEKTKIYLDICSYNRPFDDQSQIKIHLETEAILYVQDGIRKKKYLMIWSYMLDYENSRNPYKAKRNAIALWKNIACDYCQSSIDVLSTGTNIMKNYSIKAKDSLHIACAIKNNCDYFITTDNKLIKKSSGHIAKIGGDEKSTSIKIINPIDFVREREMEGLDE